MDGNNRWSKKNSKTKYESYKLGANKLISLSDYIFSNTDVNFISAFALSSNNLERSSNIIKIIKKILSETLTKYQNNKTNYDLIFINTKLMIFTQEFINNSKRFLKPNIFFLSFFS